MSLAGAATERVGAVSLSEAIVEVYERIVPLAARQVACLRKGDLDGFDALLGEKERLIDTVHATLREANDAASDFRERTGREVNASGTRLAARAEEAIRSALASDEEALTILVAARDRVSGELAQLALGGSGMKSYRGAQDGFRVVDRRG